MIQRDMTRILKEYASQFSAVAIVGPRQSGKTTLAREVFKQYLYISLEEPDIRDLAFADPRRFLTTFAGQQGVILDEIQHAPHILSYLQTIIDQAYKPGYFIITGSQNFLVNEAITQTLAGRIGFLTLLPFSLHEQESNELLPTTLESAVFLGCYPRIYDQKILPTRWYPNYITAYLERDVRQLKHVTELRIFQNFIRLCAGRIGQLLNVSSLASDCGIAVATAKAWLSILQASYIIFFVQPHHKNFSKRIIKSPKLFFYDTGLVCSLLGIDEPKQLLTHYLRGNLVESYLLSDLYKQYYNAGLQPRLTFWRDNHGNEIDCIIESAGQLVPVEIKSSQTIGSDFSKAIRYLQSLSKDITKGYLIYDGVRNYDQKEADFITWRSAGKLIESIRMK